MNLCSTAILLISQFFKCAVEKQMLNAGVVQSFNTSGKSMC